MRPTVATCTRFVSASVADIAVAEGTTINAIPSLGRMASSVDRSALLRCNAELFGFRAHRQFVVAPAHVEALNRLMRQGPDRLLMPYQTVERPIRRYNQITQAIDMVCGHHCNNACSALLTLRASRRVSQCPMLQISVSRDQPHSPHHAPSAELLLFRLQLHISKCGRCRNGDLSLSSS